MNIRDLIPEFFFDIIARIPPGIFLLLLILKFIFHFDIWTYFQDISISDIILLVLFGYSIGIVLSAPAKLFGKLYTKFVWTRFIEREKDLIKNYLDDYGIDINLDLPKKLSHANIRTLYRETHDFAKSNNEQAKLLLPKLSAESSVANNFATAITFFTIYLLITNYWFHSTSYSGYIFLFLLIIVVVLIFVGAERYDRLLGSQFAYFRQIRMQEVTPDDTYPPKQQEI